jgi:anti-sigma factor RsiW
MISHRDTTVMMSLALDGMLSPAEQTVLEEHLESCPSCRAMWTRWQSVEALLSTQPMVAPAVDFSDRVLAKLDQQVAKKSRVRRIALLGGSLSIWGILVAALGIAAALWFLSDPALLARWAHSATRVVSTCALLYKGLRLGLSGVMGTDALSSVVSCASVVMGLAVLAALLVQQARKQGAIASASG